MNERMNNRIDRRLTADVYDLDAPRPSAIQNIRRPVVLRKRTCARTTFKTSN